MPALTNRKQNSGFTLAELLVVVAIIGVLVAVSIPIFTSQLEKSREATDAANERSAKAAAAVFFYDEKFGTYYYDAASGTLKDSANDIVVYGKGTTAGSIAEDHTKKLLKCVIAQDGTITITWSNGGIISNISLSVTDKSGKTTTYNNPEEYLYGLLANLGLSMVKNSRIDSTGDTSNINSKIYKISQALSTAFSDTNIQAWKLMNEDNQYYAYITDVDITKLKSGTKVKVIRYSKTNNTYTATYVDVTTMNYGGKTYQILQQGVGSEISGQTADTKKSYEDTVKIFNSAASTQ